MSGLLRGGWGPRLAVGGLVSAVLTGCSLLPGSNPRGIPSVDAPSPATSSVVRSAAPTPAAPEPSVGLTAPPRVQIPSAEPAEPVEPGEKENPGKQGLAYRSRTLRGRSGSATWEISIPVFSGAKVAAEVNRRVGAAADDLIGQVRREAKGDGGTQRSLTGQGTVVTNDGRTVQVTIGFVDYLAGTASPANYVTTTVVDVRGARPVLLKQVIQNPPDGLRFLKAEVLKAAKKKGEPVEQAGLAPKLANWANWQTTPAGLTFYFNEYQLGGRGVRAYTVPWSRAKLVLSAYGEKLLM